jgi:protein-tyrosine phosphatase
MSWRRVTLDGAVNLRDFGGYETADGRRVRRRRLYRSGHMAELSDTGRQRFAELGIGLICDLRRPEERTAEPTPFPEDAPRRIEIPIDPGSAMALRAHIRDREMSLRDRIDFMVAINRELARDHAEDFAHLFAELLELDDEAFLVHCSAGKDRTGFACALILHALGVPRETVFDDYLLTNEFMDYEQYVLPRLVPRWEPHGAPDRETVMALAGVRPEYLEAAFHAIEADFDGVEQYIERAVGLTPERTARLRRRLLE